MSDLNLVRQLRDIDTPVSPSAEFADELFGSLTLLRRRRSFTTDLGRVSLFRAVAAGAAVVVLLAFGAAYLAGDREPANSPGVMSSPTPEGPSARPTMHRPASPAADPSDAAVPPPLTESPRWQFWRAGADGPVMGEVHSIVRWADGLLAAGVEQGADGPNGPEMATRVWLSRDGTAWDPFEFPATGGGLGAIYVAADGAVVVAGSADGRPTSASMSIDGDTWTSINFPDVADPVVEGRPGAYLMFDRERATAAPWQSSDGLVWDQLDADLVDTGWVVTSVAVGDRGRLVSTCQQHQPFASQNDDCRTLASADGITWQRSATLPGTFQVVAYGGGWIAAALVDHDAPSESAGTLCGAADSAEPTCGIHFWRSDNGLEWSPVSRITEGFINGVPDRLLVAGDYLILKAGTSYTRSFISNDALNWVPLGLTDLYVRDAEALGNEVVVVGRLFAGSAGIWHWTSE